MTDDELAVELVTEPPPRPPRRWPQVALLLAAVAVVIAVGTLDDGGDDETSLPTTTTSTTVKRTTTTRRVHRVTTTTTLPRFEPGDSTLLPDAAGSHLVLVHASGLVHVLDLTTGGRCVNTIGVSDAWLPFSPNASSGSSALLLSERGLATIDATCSVAWLRPSSGDGYAAARTDDAVWFMHGDGAAMTAIGFDGSSGPTIDVPGNAGAWIFGAGHRLVLGVAGSITLVDPATDARRDLGTGTPIAVTDHQVAVLSCPRLACALSLLDVDTGRRRRLGGPELRSVGEGAFSPDGRWFAATINTNERRPRAYVVDVRTNSTIEVDADTVIGFTAGSTWLLAQSGSNIVAIRPDGSERRIITNAAGTNGTAVLRTPPD